VMDDILLDQCPSLLIEENLAPIRSGLPLRPTGEMLLGVVGVVNLRVLQYHKQLRGQALHKMTTVERNLPECRFKVIAGYGNRRSSTG
jgi:hypothetical protein